jgi:hypothetical protein
MTRSEQGPSPIVVGTLTGIGVAIGVIVAVMTSDVILGVIAGASFTAITAGLARLWAGAGTRHPRHP